MDPLGAVCSMTNPSQSNQISMTNFARSQQKRLRKICGKFKFFGGVLNSTILAFRMYACDSDKYRRERKTIDKLLQVMIFLMMMTTMMMM